MSEKKLERKLERIAAAINAMLPARGEDPISQPEVLAVGGDWDRGVTEELCKALAQRRGAQRAVSLHNERAGIGLYAIESVEVQVRGVRFRAQFSRSVTTDERERWDRGERRFFPHLGSEP